MGMIQRKKCLMSHYSSGSSKDAWCQQDVSHSKPKHVRAKTRYAGRFEVSDLDHSGAFSPAMNLSQLASAESIPTPIVKPEAEPKIEEEGLTTTSSVKVKNERVIGRFQVADLSSSPPQNDETTLMGKLMPTTSESSSMSVESDVNDEDSNRHHDDGHVDLDACDATDLLMAVNRKVSALEAKVARLREENSRLKHQLDDCRRHGGKTPMLRVSSSSCVPYN